MGPMHPCDDPNCSFCSLVFRVLGPDGAPRARVGGCFGGGACPPGRGFDPRREPRMPPWRTEPAGSAAYPAAPPSKSDEMKEVLSMAAPLVTILSDVFASDKSRARLQSAAVEQEALAGARLAEAAHWAIVAAKNGVSTDAWAVPLADAIDNFTDAQETRIDIAAGVTRAEPIDDERPDPLGSDLPMCSCLHPAPSLAPEMHPPPCALGEYVRKYAQAAPNPKDPAS